jgi:hypothetical protein
MFLLFAAIFAFFSLKSFRFLIDNEKFDNSLSAFLLAGMFILSNSIFNINGVRFWTATWVGVYCVFQIFRNENKKYFLLVCITPFIHVAFFVYAFLIVIAYFAKRFEKFWIIMLVISFLVSNLSFELAASIVKRLPLFIANVAQAYINPEDAAILEENRGIIQSIFRFAERIYLNFILWLFILNRKEIKGSSKAFNLYSFLIVWMTFINFTMPIPSLGIRFMHLSLPIFAYIWLVSFKGIKYRQILYAYPVVFLFSLYVLFVQHYPKVTSWDLYLMNPFYLIQKYLLV